MFLAMNAGLLLPERMIDLRPQAPRFSKRRIRSVEEAVVALVEGAPPGGGAGGGPRLPPETLQGRGGARLRAQAAVLDVLGGPRA